MSDLEAIKMNCIEMCNDVNALLDAKVHEAIEAYLDGKNDSCEFIKCLNDLKESHDISEKRIMYVYDSYAKLDDYIKNSSTSPMTRNNY